MARKMTPGQARKAQIEKYKMKIENLKREARQKAQLEAERQELHRLRQELHPSKLKRFAKLLGKAEHGGLKVAKGFAKAHKELKKADKSWQEFIHKDEK
jgi:hypothetical protein